MKIKSVKVVILESKDRNLLKSALGNLRDAMDTLSNTDYERINKNLVDVYDVINSYVENIDEP